MPSKLQPPGGAAVVGGSTGAAVRGATGAAVRGATGAGVDCGTN